MEGYSVKDFTKEILEDLPYDGYVRILDEYVTEIGSFKPSNMEKDLSLGEIGPLVYWYPNYVAWLYDIAWDAHNFRDYLNSFNRKNSYYFEKIFPMICKKLDTIMLKGVKRNHFDEVQLKNGDML